MNVGNREFCCAASEDGDWCSNYGNSVEVPQKRKDRAGIPILGIYLQEMKTEYGRIIRTPHSCCVMHNRQEMETYFPGDEGIKKNVARIYIQYSITVHGVATGRTQLSN